MDEILFFRYRKIKLLPPLFIISNPRSGTTFLHNMMCLDTNHFTHIKLYQALLPSISIIKLINIISFFDYKIGRPLGKLVNKFEKKFFSDWQKIHPLGFNQPEEDEPIFILAMVTPVYYLLCPFINEINYLTNMDKMNKDVITNMMSFYKNSLKRLAYVLGRDKRLLIKNALASARIQSFINKFPMSNYVYIYRNPQENISSLVSILNTAWQKHSPELLKDSIYLKQIALMGVEFYTHFLDSSRRINSRQLYSIQFTDLVKDPEETICSLYNYFAMDLSPETLTALKNKIEKNKNYKSRHVHNLNKEEIREEELKKLMPDVYKKYSNE